MTQAKGHISPDSVTTSLTRRAALIGLAAVAAPATAGAVCIAPAEVDPIFAVIAEHEAAWRAAASASIEADRYREEFPDAESDRPTPLVRVA